MVALWHEGRLLVIRNSYRSCFSAPAGNLRRGETPAQAAARELNEEVGIRLAPEQLRYVREVVHTMDFKQDHSHVFEVQLDEAPTPEPDRREVVWAGYLPPEEVLPRSLSVPLRTYLEDRLAAEGRVRDDR